MKVQGTHIDQSGMIIRLSGKNYISKMATS